MIALAVQRMLDDGPSTAVTAVAMVAMFGGAELAYRAFGVNGEYTRKFTHVFAGLWVVACPWLFTTSTPMIVLCGAFAGLMALTNALGLLPSVHGVDRGGHGPALYPIGVIGAGLLLWDRPALFRAAVLTLALGDAAAALVGRARGRRKYAVRDFFRTLEGSATLFAVAFTVTFALGGGSGAFGWVDAALVGLVVACAATAAEGVSSHGVDNVAIPLVSALLLDAVSRAPERVPAFAGYAALSAAIVLVALWRRNLTVSGALGAWLVGFVAGAAGGAAWFGALLLMFVGVNVASRVGASRKPKQAKGATRDHLQVFANVGVGALIAIPAVVWPHPALLAGFMGALGFAGADTLASELGVLWSARPVSIVTLKEVPLGASGGVSLGGYGAAVLGGLLPPVGFALGDGLSLPVLAAASALAGGVFGCTVDSVLGATVQARLRCPRCGAATEAEVHCDGPTELVGGVRAIDNDAVNLLGSAAAAAIGVGLWALGVR